MFPFSVGNNYAQSHFPFGMPYPLYPPPYPNVNQFAFPYSYPNYIYSNLESIPNCHLKSPNMQRMSKNVKSDYPLISKVTQRKKLTKRLVNIQMKKTFSNLSKQFKQRKRTFKYLDPSRAPPISSLRNQEQLQLDLKKQLSNKMKLQACSSQDKLNEVKKGNDLLKLGLLLEQPNNYDYPFLICKKRKYYRNLKRRYSVAYFQQRASYINNKQPIPPQLHPKNKVRKSRGCNKLIDDAINEDSQENDSELQSSCSMWMSNIQEFSSDKIEIKKKYENENLKQVVKSQQIDKNSE